MQGSNPGARHPTTQKQRAKQRPRQQRKGQPKQQQKKTTKRPRKNPTLVQARNCNQDSARKNTKTTRNTATKAPRKTGTKMTTPTLVPGNNPSLLDKTIVLAPQNEVRKAYQKPTPWARSSPVPAMCLEANEPAHKHPTQEWPFWASCREKNTGNVDPKIGSKIWTRFWGPRKEKTIWRTPKRSPDFAPNFRVHIAHVWAKSNTRQAEQKLWSKPARHNLGKKLVQSTNVSEVKGYMTKPKPTKISEKHNKILRGIESLVLRMARPGRSLSLQNLSFSTCEAWAGRARPPCH